MSFSERFLLDAKPWFQEKEHFEIGKCYSMILVETRGVHQKQYSYIPSDTNEVYLGYFIKAKNTGYGDNSNVVHTFAKLDDNGNKIEHTVYLDYSGGTRFKKVICKEKKLVIQAGIDALASKKTEYLTQKVLGYENLNRLIQEYL